MALSPHDRLAIHETISLHGHLFDEGELGRLGELFTEDVVYDLSPIGQAAMHGIEEIRAAALELGPDNPLAHHVTNVVITDEGEGTATTRCKALALTAEGTTRSATYIDTLDRTETGWRIRKRVVVPRRSPLGGKRSAAESA